jgi:hypothetical protein
MSSLTTFWQAFKHTSNQPQVHPLDRQWMQEFWRGPLEAPIYQSWEEYLQSARFGSYDSEPHLSLLPVPYVGDLKRAKAIIFLANAGFVDADYYLDFSKGFGDLMLRNIRQEELEYPFIYLDPNLAWSEAYQWWERKLRPLLGIEVGRSGSYRKALGRLSREIAVVELFPYHSRDASTLKGFGPSNSMPSVAAARGFLAEISGADHVLKLVMRKHNAWVSPECAPESEHYVHGPRTQGFSLDPKFTPGRELAKRLFV